MTTVNLVAYCGSDLLKNAWIYVKQGDAFNCLRSDADGLVLKTISTDPQPEIASFIEPLLADAPSTLLVAWSHNGMPLPSKLLKLVEKVFIEARLELKPENMAPLPAAPIASHETNTIQAAPMLKVVFPALPVTFVEPVSLQLWPMFAEPFAADYATSGLAQGESLWQNDRLTLRDGHPATSASAQKMPTDLGVGVRGSVTNGAKQVDLYLLDCKGEKLKFRLKAEVNAPASDVTTVEVKTVDGKNTFAVRLYVDDPQRFFGLVQLVAVTKQGQPDGWGNVTAMLLGVQLGLCDDHLQASDGTLPGPPIGPGDEENVIDFTTTAVSGPLPAAPIDSQSRDASTQTAAAKNAARAALAPHTRARRMVCFSIRADRKRPNPQNASGPEELRPEMPLWMAELQLVGFRPEEGQAFLQMRQAEFGVDNRAVAIRASFALTLSWRGPDDDLPSMKGGKLRNRHSRLSMTFKGTFRGKKAAGRASGTGTSPPASPRKASYDSGAAVSGTIDVEDDGALKVSKEGMSTADVDPPYAAAPFPLPGRRTPALWLSDRKRGWGWTADGPVVPTLVLEWQPPIVEAKQKDFTEIMLGGDGQLEVGELSFAGASVARPRPSPPSPATMPAGPLLVLPTFRVKGANPAKEHVNSLVDAAVDDVVASHPDVGPVQMLSGRVWKALAHCLMTRESDGQQFSDHVTRPVYMEKTPFQCHGIQSGMPKFGAPAGYGIGQHDPPRSSQDMWNFYEHIRVGIEELIVTRYGKGAYDFLTQLRPSEALSPTSRLDKAVFLREAVRAYNGCHEFVCEDGQWRMSPWRLSKGRRVAVPAKRLSYANRTLGTTVTYRLPTRPEEVVNDGNIATIAGVLATLL